MKVSVLVISYNQENYIRQCLESIISQKTDFQFEIVIGDDASKDSTAYIINEYALQFPELIKPILRENNIGMNYNFLDVLANCSGEYIALCEGDDYWTDATKLQTQVEFMDVHSDAAVSFHNVSVHYENNDFPDHNFYSDKPIYPNNIKPPKVFSEFEDIITGNFIQTCSAMFRRNLINEFPSWFATLPAGDWVIHILNAQYGKLAYIELNMATYRVHSAGVWSGTPDITKIERTCDILNLLNGHFNNSHQEAINKKIIEHQQNLARIFINEAYNLLANKDYNSSLLSVNKALEVFGKLGNGKSGLFLVKAVCLANLGKTEEALESVTNEMILYPENEESYELHEKFTELLESQNKKLDYKSYKESVAVDKPQEEIDSKYVYDVSIIIPVFNNVAFTKECLKALYENSGDSFSYEVIVVDNCSSDGTNDILEEYETLHNNFIVIRNFENLGFAKACNQGILARKGRAALLLNNDTQPQLDWLNGIMEEIITEESVGAAGALLLYPETDLIQHIFVKIGTEDGKSLAPYHPHRLAHLGEVEEAMSSRDVSAITGACFLISEDAINKVGLLDEEYINGLEDIDYCFRLTQAGFKIRYSANSIVYHAESMTANRHEHDVANWIRLNQKWYGLISLDESQFSTNQEVAAINRRERIIRQNMSDDFEELTNIGNEVKDESIKLSLIIPVHNSLELTKQCINSIFTSVNVNKFEVIIINNASTDGTAEYLNSILDKVSVITNTENLSFSKVNNQAAAIAKASYLLFLNNDTKLFDYALDAFIEGFDSDQQIGIQGGKLIYPNGMVQHAGIAFGHIGQNIMSHLHIYVTFSPDAACVNIAREYQMVTGAMLAIRKRLFVIADGFDEEYVFGHEDLDLCLKIRKLGYKVVYNPEAVAIHYESITKKDNGIEKFERYYKNPNSFDAKNEKLFQSRWSNFIEIDAEKYLIEDGYWGYVQNPEYSLPFWEKVKQILFLINELVAEGHTQRVEEIVTILTTHSQKDVITEPLEFKRLNIQTLDTILNNFYPNEDELNSEELGIKKNLLFTMYGWNESGGGTTFPRSVAIELAKQFNVFVFYAAGKHNDSHVPYYLEESYDEGVILFGVYNRPTNFLDVENPEREVRDVNIVNLFTKVLDDVQPALVHYHNFLGLSFAIADVVKERNIPTLYTPHNYHLIDPNLYMIKKDFNKWSNTDFQENSELVLHYPNKDYAPRKAKALDLLNNKIDHTLAVSKRVRELLCEFGGDTNKISVVNQIPKLDFTRKYDTDNFTPMRFAFIGGAMPHKGVHNILIASQFLEPSDAEIHIWGFISIGYKKALESFPSKLKIKFCGEYTTNDLPKIAESCDAVIIPSIWEDCAPLVLAECLALGLPVIGARIGGIPDFIKDDYNGALYTYNSPIELSIKMKKLINDPRLLNDWKENTGLTYNFNYYVDFVSSIYNKLINKTQLNQEDLNLHFLDDSGKSTQVTKAITTPEKLVLKTVNITQTKIQEKFEMQENLSNETERQEPEIPAMNRLQFTNDLQHGFANKTASGTMPNPLPSPLYLNLGCGKDVREDFVNVDLFSNDASVVAMDIRKLNIAPNSADYILASDVLEHFSHRETDQILKEWARVLKPGGVLEIRCPSLKLQMQAYMRGDWNADIASYMIFGGQTNPGDYHCVAFDEQSIRNHLTHAGLEVYDYEEHDFPQTRGFINLNMTVKARKFAFDDVSADELKNSYTMQEPKDQDLFGGGDIEILDYDGESNDNLPDFPLVPEWEYSDGYNPQLNIVWEGSQMVYHSLALINREQSYYILKSEQANLTIVPYENDKISPLGNSKFEALFANDIRVKGEVSEEISSLPYVWIRHQWPPKEEAPMGAKWIIMQPWEFTQLRKDFVELFNDVEEVWTPSNFCRNVYIASGVNPDKVQIIPNGIDPKLFTPIGRKYELKTKKKIKFLFVGGTISRKGIDILLSAYLRAFTSSDNVCLVIKDMGGESFYRGQTAQQLIRDAQNTPNAPEIEYIDSLLTEEDIASLYRSCSVFVSPYRGEGFSLPTLEAMASGLPVVVTKGGATDDFVDESIGWQIPSEMLSIGSVIDGKELTGEAFFLEPHEETLIQILKDIYENPTNLIPIGLLAALRARSEWTWDRAGLKMMTRLDFLCGTTMAKNIQSKIVQDEDPINTLGKAEYYYNNGKVPESKEYFIKAIELGIDNLTLNTYAHCAIAMILIEEENYSDAYHYLDVISRLDSKNIDVRYLQVKLFALKEELTEALELMTPILDDWTECRFESAIGLTLDHILSYTADILFAMSDFVGAVELYEMCLKVNSDNLDGMLGMALAQRNLGNSEEAKKQLERVLMLNPMNEEAKEVLNLINSGK